MKENIAPLVFDELVKEEVRYERATKGQRLVNFIVDTTLYYVFLYKLFQVSDGLMSSGHVGLDSLVKAADRSVIILFAIGALPIMYALFEGITKGRSPGKYLTGTIATRNDLTAITWSKAILRSFLRALPVDTLSGLFGPPLHDRWSRTMVVKKSSIVY